MLKIASINIERSKHLERVQSFLHYHRPDVLCLQELCQRDIPLFEDLFGQKMAFVPQRLHPAEIELEPMGIGLIARQKPGNVAMCDRFGQQLENRDINPDFHQLRMVFATVTDGTHAYRIGTTHFPVTHGGSVTEEQMGWIEGVAKGALAQAKAHGGLLLTGDFNAPRGRKAFDTMATYLQDGVPPEYTSSIDGSLHRAGALPYVVDGLFHTPNYKLSGAALHTGVSDHKALTATLGLQT